MEEEFSIEKAVQIFQQRIIDLSKFEGLEDKAVDQIRDERTRGLTRVGKKTLELNKYLLAVFGKRINSRLC